MVLTHSSIGISFAIIVEIILLVRIAKIFALTPLPKPSAKTIV